MERERLHDVDTAKGLAILLVVVGHISLSDPPQNAEWYIISKYLIYKFHMPFFMYLSGVVMYYTYTPIKHLNSYCSYIGEKFFRLAPGFFLFAVIRRVMSG